MITQKELLAMLERLEPRNPKATDWRRVGKAVVRFVDWRKLAEGRRP